MTSLHVIHSGPVFVSIHYVDGVACPVTIVSFLPQYYSRHAIHDVNLLPRIFVVFSRNICSAVLEFFQKILQLKPSIIFSANKSETPYYTNPLQTSALLNFRNLNVYVVGEVGHPKARVVRVVHISDTRGAHEAFTKTIPKGHILIHSGDFASRPPSLGLRLSNWCRRIGDKLPRFKKHRPVSVTKDWRQQVKELDEFFSKQPHDYKIFVPGCWETWYASATDDKPTPEKIQSLLPSAIYLEDSWCRIFGLTIYGSPWTAADDLRPEDGAFTQRHFSTYTRCLRHSSITSHADYSQDNKRDDGDKDFVKNIPSTTEGHYRSNGFVLPSISDVAQQWRRIPDHTNIVVTHMPAWRPELYSQIAGRIKPVLHLCGHDFAGYGVMWKQGILFSNAALQLNSSFPATGLPKKDTENSSPNHTNRDRLASCSLDPAPPERVSCTFTNSLSDFREPQLYTGRSRPPRWQRRLPKALSRLLFATTGSAHRPAGTTTHTTGNTGCSFFRRSHKPNSTVIISPTQSSKAAIEQAGADSGFIYDPDMRAGIGAMAVTYPTCSSNTSVGYAGGSTGLSGSNICSSSCRRSPMVVDVYVVCDYDDGLDDNTNHNANPNEDNDDRQSLILPPYASSLLPHYRPKRQTELLS